MNVATLTPPRVYTPDDLLSMPEGERYELLDGQLVEREMSNESSWVAGEIYRRISNHVIEHRLGWAYPDGTSFQCFGWDADRVRRPDAAFICRERLPNGPIPLGHCRVVPDLAVEVISPHDLFVNVDEKIDEYLRAGVRLVWVVNPAIQTVTIHRAGQPSPPRLNSADELTGEDVLPGFRCRVADLFPQMTLPTTTDTPRN